MSSSSSGAETRELRALQLSLGVYVVVFVLKMGVYAYTHVLALMAEGFHTLADILITAFLLGALVLSRKAPDPVHTFGHKRAQNAAGLVAATLFLSFTSYKLYEESIPRLFRPETVTHENVGWAIGVLVLSMLIAAAPLVQMVAQHAQGAASRAMLAELINDELGLAAALAGTLLVMAGYPRADPLAAMAVATIIAVNALKLFRDNASYLLGRSPGSARLEEMRRAAAGVEGVVRVGDLRSEYVGPQELSTQMTIEVARGLPIEDADAIAERVRLAVTKAAGVACGYLAIHVDPAGGPGPSCAPQEVSPAPAARA